MINLFYLNNLQKELCIKTHLSSINYKNKKKLK